MGRIYILVTSCKVFLSYADKEVFNQDPDYGSLFASTSLRRATGRTGYGYAASPHINYTLIHYRSLCYSHIWLLMLLNVISNNVLCTFVEFCAVILE